MHDQICVFLGNRLVGGHLLHRDQDELAAEDFLVTSERLATVTAEEKVGMKAIGPPIWSSRLILSRVQFHMRRVVDSYG
jgi:hypothetical protein